MLNPTKGFRGLGLAVLMAAGMAEAQDVVIYPDTAAASSTKKTVRSGERLPAVPVTPKAEPPVVETRKHIVSEGETLWKISRKYRVSVDDIQKLNGLKGNVIRPGQTLLISGKEIASIRPSAPAKTPDEGAGPPQVRSPDVGPRPSAGIAHIEPKPTPRVVKSVEVVPDKTEAALVRDVPQVTQVKSSRRDLRTAFLSEVRRLAGKKVGYNDRYRPYGEKESWPMDCSNTVRYLYRRVTGITLERVASDQYFYLKEKNKAWDAPRKNDGGIDVAALQERLKPGDLLFWEDTYKPVRRPPVTHVMVYLGLNDEGKMIMGGSQTSSGGESKNPDGGPDVYPFYPARQTGGYRNWIFGTFRPGRFTAYGRPVES